MKNIQYIIAFLIFGMMINACTTTPRKMSTSKPDHGNVELGREEIFMGDKVQAFLQNKKLQSDEAKASFLKGLDFFKNKKDGKKAVELFIESILYEPTGIAYYEMGNALMEYKNYTDAIKAYGMAEQVGYEPFSKILYNMACAYSLLKETEMAGQYLEYAIQAGYSNIDQIEKDPDLNSLREESYLYKEHMRQGLNGVSNAENLFWLQFKKQFTKSELPMVLDPFIDIKNIENLEAISYDFEKYVAEMRDEKFSRDVSKGFFYNMNLKETENYVALVYLVRDYYLGELAPVTYRLVTFTHDGHLIDKKEIAGRESLLDDVRVASIDKKLNLKVEYFEVTYKKDTEEFGYEDNPIVEKKLKETKKFFIDKNGKIELSSDLSVALN